MENVIEKLEDAIEILKDELEKSIIKGRKALEFYNKANPVESIIAEQSIQKRISITYNIEKTIKKLRKQIVRLERISSY